MRNYFNSKGMITVEACLSFPIFLCFFLMLVFLIKLASIDLVLQHTANEAAKQLASSVYPIKFLNEMEDETFLGNPSYGMPAFESELREAQANISGSPETGDTEMLAILLAGDKAGGGNGYGTMEEFFGSVIGKELDGLEAGVKGYIANKLGDSYYEIKNKIKYEAAKAITEEYIAGSCIEKNRLEYMLIQLPQSTVEYDIRNRDGAYINVCKAMGYTPHKDDVVIVLKYDVQIPVPFFRDRVITLKHAGIERAWLKGSNGIYSEDLTVEEKENTAEEDSAVEESYRKLDEDTVYITRTGTKYHKYDCPCLSSSRIPIGREDAESKGYGICRVCSNKGKWNFYK